MDSRVCATTGRQARANVCAIRTRTYLSPVCVAPSPSAPPPGTPVQAQSLIDAGLELNSFVVIGADYDALVQRVGGRRFDPKTGATYHIQFNPPPVGLVADRCVIRSDDTPEVMRARLATYDATVAGVVKQFADVRVVQCDARAGIFDVFAQIARCIENAGTRSNIAIRAKSANTKRRLTANL